MSLPLLLLALGGILLYVGAEWFVLGASRLALALRIPQLVVGLTVVAYGTSAPEVVVGLAAASSGHGEVALANVLGSNVANVGLILGATLWVGSAHVDASLRRRELPVLLGCTLLLPVLLWDGRVGGFEGTFLLLMAAAYTAFMVRSARSAAAVEAATSEATLEAEAADAAGAPSASSAGRSSAVAIGGLLAILAGGRLFVDGAVALAHGLGLSDRLVGLTVVAVGTSLPELVTSVVAARRGHGAIAVGNVIGSNIFNILLCLGGCAVVAPLEVRADELTLELVAAVASTGVMVLAMALRDRLPRGLGVALLIAYGAFLTAVGVRG